MVPDRPALALVVLNWNGLEDTLECLGSLRESSIPVYSIVVDNGSAKHEADQIRESGLADLVIETGRNLGYAEGNNVGLRHALGHADRFPYIGVLNNDTIVEPDCMRILADRLGSAAGENLAVAPTMLYADGSRNVWFAGGVLDGGWPRHLQADELKPNGPVRPSAWLTGCCILARTETWQRVGLFDPSYYLIFEDCEWSLRARGAGVELAIATYATILHKVSRSFQSGSASMLGSFYFLRNGLRFNWTYRRRHVPLFTLEHLLLPTARALAKNQFSDDLWFRWIGAAAFLRRQEGQAPKKILERAQRRRAVIR